MGIIVADDFVQFTPSARSADASFPASNVSERWHLGRLFKCQDAAAANWLLKLDLGSSKAVEAIFINHVNFTAVTIEGSDTDVWTSPAFTASAAIGRDEIVGRYKAWLPLTAFEYRYLRLSIPSGQTPTSDSVWFVGGISLMGSYLELSRDVAEVKRKSGIPFDEVVIGKRVVARVPRGTMLAWEGSVNVARQSPSSEADLWALNAMDIDQPVLWYQNGSDTSKAYLCLRDDDYEGSLKGGRRVSGNTIGWKEIGV